MASCTDDFSEDKSVTDDFSVANLDASSRQGSEAPMRPVLSSFSYDKMDNNHADSHLSVSTGSEAYTTVGRIPPSLPINFAFNVERAVGLRRQYIDAEDCHVYPLTLRIDAWLECLDLQLTRSKAVILCAREQPSGSDDLLIWQPWLEGVLNPLPLKLSALTHDSIRLILKTEINGVVHRGQLNAFDDLGCLQNGLHVVRLQRNDSQSDATIPQASHLQSLESLLYERKKGQMPAWHVDILKERLHQLKVAELEHGGLLVSLFLPKPSHPIRLDVEGKTRLDATLSSAEVCMADMNFAQKLALLKRKHRKLFALLKDEADTPHPNPRDLCQIHAFASFSLETSIPPDKANLLWTHRHYLSARYPELLPLFVQSVQWWLAATDQAEIEEAMRVIELWWIPSGKRELSLPLLAVLAGGERKQDGACWRRVLERILAKKKDQEWLLNVALEAIMPVLKQLPESLAHWLQETIRVCAQSDPRLTERLFWFSRYQPGIVSLDSKTTEELRVQTQIIDRIDSAVRAVQGEGNAKRRLDCLRSQLSDPNAGLLHVSPSTALPGLVHPVNSAVRIISVLPERCHLFKSTATCALLTFTDPSYSSTLKVIYKRGDDLRKDASLLRTFRLVTGLWRERGLVLIPDELMYGVVPTGEASGLVEFVESQSIASLVAADKRASLGEGDLDVGGQKTESGVLGRFLQGHPDKEAAFLNSCAGFSLLTFLFGVGDRHLDNLLVTPQGHLLHIDYAYRYGADPKPFPPPIKLSKEMVAVLGAQPGRWLQFKGLCRSGLMALSKCQDVILGAVALETGWDETALRFVRERLETSVEELDELIEESRTALLPQVLETLHKWAQYWKA